ncbi:T9SS type A sorting domain-containing protein, partial [Mucilaginibacter sp.]|uniref:T9SS type A sorting domain-containing protein n=1 Tax=Mucilaginibacter sp. TaxID=1882438 RepID=UPI002631B14D
VIIISASGSGSFSIFPNPASNVIQFSLDQKPKYPVSLRIFNTMGILMKNSTFTSTTGQQDISSLTPGNYTFELTELNSKKLLFTAKFIKI